MLEARRDVEHGIGGAVGPNIHGREIVAAAETHFAAIRAIFDQIESHVAPSTASRFPSPIPAFARMGEEIREVGVCFPPPSLGDGGGAERALRSSSEAIARQEEREAEGAVRTRTHPALVLVVRTIGKCVAACALASQAILHVATNPAFYSAANWPTVSATPQRASRTRKSRIAGNTSLFQSAPCAS